jgi:L-fuconolactonase
MIDAHQHFWRIGRHGQQWPTPDLTVLHRDVLPDELGALAQPLGVTGSVAVQSQPNDADTDFLLALAAGRPFVRGVVGWIDMEATEAPRRLDVIAEGSKLCGLRPMLQSLERDDWIAEAPIEAAVARMVELGLVFDALVYARHLPHLLAFARRWPQLSIVIDHAAKPAIGGDMGDWSRGLASLAALPNVHCKLSGLLTEAPAGSPAEAVRPVIDQVLAAFGPGQVLWGSDWPVLNLAGDYAGWLALCRRAVAAADHPAVFGGNARRLYRLSEAADD